MRRPTFVVLVVLFVALLVASIVQLTIDRPASPLPGPTSPGQLPIFSPAPTP